MCIRDSTLLVACLAQIYRTALDAHRLRVGVADCELAHVELHAAVRAAVRERGLSYSRFMEGLSAAGVEVDRKILADLSVNDSAAFDAIFDTAKSALESKAA